MQIEILGARGEIKEGLPNYRLHSGILVDGQILLDAGELEFLNRHPKWILVTHLHADHAVFVREQWPSVSPPIYAPEDSWRAKVKVASQPFTLGGYHITPIPTQHSHRVRSQGYRIDDGARSLLYTGDMFGIDENFKSVLVHLDMVITDGSFMKRGGLVRKSEYEGLPYGHTGIPDLVDLFAPYTKKIVITHLGSWFFGGIELAKFQLGELAKEKQVEITLAYEGLMLTV